MIFFQQFYLDKEKDIAVDLCMEGDRLFYTIRTPNHHTGNLITNLARLCGLETTEDDHGLKVIRDEIPCYYDGDNRKMYILRLGNTKIANIFPDGRVELKASIPAISKTLMSQTREYKLGVAKTIVKTYIRSECKFRTDLHTHMNGNLPPDALIALGIVRQLRYPYYYIKKLGLRCDLSQTAKLEERRTAAEKELEQGRLEQARRERISHALEEDRAGKQEMLKEILSDIEGLHQSRQRDTDRAHRLELSRARTEGDLKALRDRIWNTYEITYAGAEEFRITEGFSLTEADREAAQLSAEIRALGPVNVRAVEEYADTKARADEIIAQREDLEKAEQDLKDLIARLLAGMKETFVEQFTLLQGYFSETFVRLFGGGHAELILMDPSDPLNCGIEINAQPPGKKLQLLSLLSGGERTLTAIAILFATLKLKPTPFCILDEIEAALDDANIGYFADYLAEYSASTQFVVITHRKGTMERANGLYGVAMEEQGVSRMVSVSLQDYREA